MDILAWSPLMMTLPFIIVGGIAFFLGAGVLAVFARQAADNPLTMPVAAFAGTITTAWALSLGFTAVDVWLGNFRASQVASEERSSMMRLAGMAKPEALASAELMAGLVAYKNAVGGWSGATATGSPNSRSSKP